MPSGGMRRTTRVCGVVKGADGARVLRSGRRLLPNNSGDVKTRRANDGDECLSTLIKSTTNSNKNRRTNSSIKRKEKGWTRHRKLKQETPGRVPKREVKSENSLNSPDSIGRKRFGLVYTRKRRRDIEVKLENLVSKKFGIQFSRRKRRRKQYQARLIVATNGSSSIGLAPFLLMVFGFMRKCPLRLSHLASFLTDEPLRNAFASSGMRFLQGSAYMKTGICKIFGVRCSVPIFSLWLSAAPSFFLYIHLRLLLSVKCLSLLPVNATEDDEVASDDEIERTNSVVKDDPGNLENKLVLHPSVRGSRLAGRHSQYRNGLNSRGIQKRRSSLRRKKARNHSALTSDLLSSRNKKHSSPSSSVMSKNNLSSSNVHIETRSGDTSSCSANLLVIDSDRCYRIEGAIITLETSDFRQWLVTIKKDGLTRYTHLPQQSIRPCSFNRATHDIMWTGNESWKLEFPNRHDWTIFKDLYRECYDRNIPAPVNTVEKAIPVPRVSEVVGYQDIYSVPFSRPDVYISVSNDEVARALSKKKAIYDMDSEDEEWLMQFNSGLFLGTRHVSDDEFELMIDAFEKAMHCRPDDFADVEAAVNVCTGLGSREVVEAVYGYWARKRKQKRSTLLRVFQAHRAKKAPGIPKPVLRKRRSLKRQASQFGRGKQNILLQAMAAQQNALEENSRRVEAAKSTAKASIEAAILKRSHAQRLMENAELAVYKASMALSIAEAAGSEISTCLLD